MLGIAYTFVQCCFNQSYTYLCSSATDWYGLGMGLVGLCNVGCIMLSCQGWASYQRVRREGWGVRLAAGAEMACVVRRNVDDMLPGWPLLGSVAAQHTPCQNWQSMQMAWWRLPWLRGLFSGGLNFAYAATPCAVLMTVVKRQNMY
jgi:hypothetical protein